MSDNIRTPYICLISIDESRNDNAKNILENKVRIKHPHDKHRCHKLTTTICTFTNPTKLRISVQRILASQAGHRSPGSENALLQWKYSSLRCALTTHYNSTSSSSSWRLITATTMNFSCIKAKAKDARENYGIFYRITAHDDDDVSL